MKIIINNATNRELLTYDIRNNTIPSRFFFAPINPGFASEGNPSSNHLLFQKERSGKGIGISYVGNVSISKKFVTNKNTAYFNNDNLNTWKKLADSIRLEGSLPGIQLACRKSSLEPNKRMMNNNHSEYIRFVQEEILSMSKKQINEIIDLFIHSAKTSYGIGFKVIQIHAAHGYFLSQFINPTLNIRRDEYNATQNKILEKIIRGIRRELPTDVIIDIRLSLLDGLQPEEVEKNYKKSVIHKLVNLEVDMISFSNGIYDINKQLIYPLKTWGHGVFINDILPFAKRHPEILWNTSGNIWDVEKLDLESLPNNLSFSIGRALIADPHFLNKSFNDLHESINHCQRKQKCHYYSLGNDHITCPIYNNSK